MLSYSGTPSHEHILKKQLKDSDFNMKKQNQVLLSCNWLLGRHGSVSLCRVERENKMAATYNVLAFKR